MESSPMGANPPRKAPDPDGRTRPTSVRPPGNPASAPGRGGSGSTEAAPSEMDRRHFLAALTAAGVSGGLFPGVLWAGIQHAPEITEGVVEAAERLAGLNFSSDERRMMVENLRSHRAAYERMREVAVPNHVAPALHFDPRPVGRSLPSGSSAMRPARPATLPDPGRPEELAFASVSQLGVLLRQRRVTSVELTRLYLDRLKRYDSVLECVVTLLPERAMEQAAQADREIESGLVRGPLHGIPWGAKDLLAVRGHPTTWGAEPYRDQILDSDATVVQRLDAAGAVLVAKLTLGSLAMGDVWFGGRTRNPWDPEQGSSGSSAGSSAAVTAGLVAFAIGSETLGSIVSPAVRCGATGLRPSFGRVSRFGAMALSWSMDKLGPLCRSAEDAALVLAATQGPDGLDRTVHDVPFMWDGEAGLDGIRVGFLEGAFDGDDGDRDRQVLRILEAQGAELKPVQLPDDLPLGALRIILNAEAAAAFDELTRSGDDARLARQESGSWPNVFRSARFIPAVEYLQANRIRSLLVSELDRAWERVDVVVSPPFASSLLLATNLTGHPAVVVPHGFSDDGTPVSISFVGGLWKDAEALRVARVFQEATDHHLRRPPGFV
jgi:Asp-tRNA(Asn)/Glu-tRNA(Gln) amidotransferase A subunit family amidase